MLQYSFRASVTVFQPCLGTDLACLAGVLATRSSRSKNFPRAEDAYLLSSHDFISAVLEVEGALGGLAGASGGPVRGAHVQGGGDAAATAR